MLRLLCPFLLLAACNGAHTSTSPAPADLAGTRWRLLTVDGAETLTSENVIAFGADGQLNVRSCNSCSGAYRTADGQLALDPMMCTKRACTADRIDLGPALTADQPFRFRVENGQFLLIATDGSRRYLFEPAE